jgi:TetR/AcrR family transcriptional repressor of mexJK operon
MSSMNANGWYNRVMARTIRIDKREAILDAALAVFGRDGFTDGAVDEIAQLAGVAKPTIYNRFGDKSGLFVEVMEAYARRANARVLGVIDSIDLHPEDLRAELERLAGALVHCVTHGDSVAVIRLQLSERARFPELLDGIRLGNRQRTLDALAGKLAQLAVAGRLRITDPARAARQFMALVSDDALSQSGFGARQLSVDEIAEPVRDGVDTFLAAFGPAAADR